MIFKKSKNTPLFVLISQKVYKLKFTFKGISVYYKEPYNWVKKYMQKSLLIRWGKTHFKGFHYVFLYAWVIKSIYIPPKSNIKALWLIFAILVFWTISKCIHLTYCLCCEVEKSRWYWLHLALRNVESLRNQMDKAM